MNARRCPSSGHWVNSSSNWSTTSSNRRCSEGWPPSAVGPSPSPAGPGGRARAACRAVSANQAGAVSRPRRTAAASAPASGATRSASSSSGARVGVNTTHGHDAAPGAAASPSARIRGSTPARSNDDFPAPDAPDTTSRPTPASSRDIRSSTAVVAASRPKNHPASCSPNTAQPAVRRTGHRSRPRPRAPGGRQHLRGRDLAASRRHEQLSRRPGQAQRTGQQHGGVLMGVAVNPPLQITDRPRAHGRRLRQLLLRQPGFSPQLPQQPGEAEFRLSGHRPSPLTTCPPRQPAPGGTDPAPNPTQARPPPPSPATLPPQASPHAAAPCAPRQGLPGPAATARIPVGCPVGFLAGGPAWCTPSPLPTVEPATLASRQPAAPP